MDESLYTRCVSFSHNSSSSNNDISILYSKKTLKNSCGVGGDFYICTSTLCNAVKHLRKNIQ